MLISALLCTLVVLNFIDIFFTLKTFRKKGYRIEENPILRDILRDNVFNFLLFKLFDILVLSIILLWIGVKNEVFALVLLGLSILLYGYIDYKNFRIQSMFE